MKFTALPKAIKTGTVVIGAKQVLSSVKNNTAKIIVYSTGCTCRGELDSLTQIHNIELVPFEGNAQALGEMCKKDYTISVLAILDKGEAEL